MCLIIHRPAKSKKHGVHVPDAVLSFNRGYNGDGFGFAWREPGEGLRYDKFAPSEYEAFYKLVKDVDADPTIEYVAHFRKATHGAACRDLSHPFTYDDPVEGQVLVFHNGIIDIKPGKGESDTSQFVYSVLANLTPQWWENSATKWFVESSIGWSRILLMTPSRTVRINPNEWHGKEKGIWYSANPHPLAQSDKGKTKGVTVSVTKNGTVTWKGGSQYTDDDYEQFMDGYEDLDERTSDRKGSIHNGHWVRYLDAERDSDDDTLGRAECSSCLTKGDYYDIGGQTFIDIAHKAYLPASTTYSPSTLADDDKEEAALLPIAGQSV